MRLSNGKQFLADLSGNQPELGYLLTDALDGSVSPYDELPVGSEVWRRASANHVQKLLKVMDTDQTADWAVVGGVISALVEVGDWTDGGAAIGTVTLADQIPAGAFVDFTSVEVLTAFATVSTLTLQVGDGSDVDRYSTGTPSIAAAGVVNVGVPSGVRHHTAAASITLTATEDSDWGDITAGELALRLHYRL